ncbi:MAG: hypothetical protein ABW200_13860 [Hyphomicrobiaceae bacterium]|jgi:hypothetical protein
MTGWQLRIVHLASTAAFAATLVLGGCSDGLEVNGKLFDWMGISSSALEQNKREPQVAARAPLVLPPNSNRLPAPGSEEQDPSTLASLNDPDRKKAAAAKERERQHLAYCRGEIQWKDRVHNKDDAGNRSPYGPCPTLLGDTLSNVNKQ